MEATKHCKNCTRDLPAQQFYKHPSTADGRNPMCGDCARQYARTRAAFNRQRHKVSPESKRCGLCCHFRPASAFHKVSASADGLKVYCRDCDGIVQRASKYGLSRERVADMLRQTACEACGEPFTAAAEKQFDHRHADGAVRGVLCVRCNQVAGKCGENAEVLLGICRYIARTMNVDYRRQPYLEQEWQSPDSSTADTLAPEGTAELCQTNTPHQPTSP
jgi:hypothetical protein